MGKLLLKSAYRVAAFLAAITSGCAVSTVSGPIWSAQTIAGKTDPGPCIVRYSVDIAGGNPWHEQHARQQWLETLATRTRNCENRAQLRVDIRQIRVRQTIDAYGIPAGGNPDAVPPPARQQVVLDADANIVACQDGETERRRFTASGWLPYTADHFLSEERAIALLNELVQIQVRQLDVLITQSVCDE